MAVELTSSFTMSLKTKIKQMMVKQWSSLNTLAGSWKEVAAEAVVVSDRIVVVVVEEAVAKVMTVLNGG